jgi:hypothetical protein
MMDIELIQTFEKGEIEHHEGNHLAKGEPP